MSRILEQLDYCVRTLAQVQEELREIRGLLERDRRNFVGVDWGAPEGDRTVVTYPQAGERLLRNPVFDRADHACERCGRKYLARGGKTPSDRWLKVKEFPDGRRAAACCNCFDAPGETMAAWKESWK